MYSFEHSTFKDWAKEQGLTLAIGRRDFMFSASINGCESEGMGYCVASAIAHLANEISEEESIFINGEMLNIPKFTEAVNVN